MTSKEKPSQQEIQALSKEFDAAAWRIANEKLHLHTIQILNHDIDGLYKYKLGDSGVLVRIKDRFFLLTASPVAPISYSRCRAESRIPFANSTLMSIIS
jgi:hypothetical protein